MKINMKFFKIILFSLFFAPVFAQDSPVNEKQPENAETSPPPASPSSAPTAAPASAPAVPSAGGNEKKDKPSAGIALSPSKIIFDAKPGMTQTREIKLVNDSKKTERFQVTPMDFTMGRTGRPENMNQTVLKYGLTNKLTVSPSYIEIKPGETAKIKVTLTVPDREDANIAGWSLISIDEIAERPPLDTKGKKDAVAMGIIPSYAFVVYIYHNPPAVSKNNIEIKKFAYKDTLGSKRLKMIAENQGDGIGFCVSYCELTHLKTGKTQKLNVKSFTILPGNQRDFFYELPKDLDKGDYNAVGVIDFGSENEIKAAELEFKVE
jgi:hypothetical protein